MMLTSHYMEEVERLATRVIIMENGKTIAQGVPHEMVKRQIGMEVLEFADSPDVLNEIERQIYGCKVSTEREDGRLLVYIKEPCNELESLAINHRHVTKRPPTLEDLFLKLTGRRLKDI